MVTPPTSYLLLLFFDSIVPTAFLSTCVIFVTLSLTALISERRSFLFLLGEYLLLLIIIIIIIFAVFCRSFVLWTFAFDLSFLLFSLVWLFFWIPSNYADIPPLSLSLSLLQIQLYLGLVLFCGFVLFDTQLIIERFNNGDNDYIWHSVDLFIDFIAIFKRLLIILASKVETLVSYNTLTLTCSCTLCYAMISLSLMNYFYFIRRRRRNELDCITQDELA